MEGSSVNDKSAIEEQPASIASRISSVLVPQGSARQAESKAVKYAQRYKLVFSLFNEDLAKGGVRSWDAEEALEGGSETENGQHLGLISR